MIDAGIEFPADSPTLWVAAAWIERHCRIPDRFGNPIAFTLYPWQLYCTLRHYELKPTAKVGQLATAFRFRRSLVVGGQKLGKSPWAAAMMLVEAAGPSVFAGWAAEGDLYICQDHGCECGWEYPYDAGEAKGIPRANPEIQLTASSVDQVRNVYAPFQTMVKRGPLGAQITVGQEFSRVGTDGRVDTVTSAALSRLGNPITACVQDEVGTWTETNKLIHLAQTQRRGAAGMQGRALGITNPPDPSQDSDGQRTMESLREDIFVWWREPPKQLSWRNKRERRKILEYVYAGCGHIDIDSIEAEAAELDETDSAQAERFFGNRMVYGQGSWADGEKWDARARPQVVPDGTEVVIGFDGSDSNDWTGFRCETQAGYQFTPRFRETGLPMIWNPAESGGQVPRLEVDAAIDELFARYTVVRLYGDPPYWKTEMDAWEARFGEERVIKWATYRINQAHAAAERLLTDMVKVDSEFHHDGCPTTATHVKHARKSPRPGERYVLAKPSPTQKIDMCMTSILCHEAAGDVTAAGLWTTTYAMHYA